MSTFRGEDQCTHKMKIIIATDIFGIGEHIEELYNELRGVCKSMEIISPYSEKKMGFASEEEAYKYFLSKCGHVCFSNLVSKAIQSTSEQVFLIGFSAGASAIWHAIGTNKYSTLIKFYGFYPSQIRNHLDLSPSCKSTIVFPSSEKDFHVQAVLEEISKNKKVECEVTNLSHGFMNPQSKNYSPEAEKTFNKRLKNDALRVASGAF